MAVVFTPYLKKAKERLPPVTRTKTKGDTGEGKEPNFSRTGRGPVVGAAIIGIVGIAVLAIARRLRIRRSDSTATPASNSGN
jgi:hypothetical protein